MWESLVDLCGANLLNEYYICGGGGGGGGGGSFCCYYWNAPLLPLPLLKTFESVFFYFNFIGMRIWIIAFPIPTFRTIAAFMRTKWNFMFLCGALMGQFRKNIAEEKGKTSKKVNVRLNEQTSDGMREREWENRDEIRVDLENFHPCIYFHVCIDLFASM